MAQDDEIRQEDAEYLEAEALPSSDNAEDVKAEEMKTAGTGGEQPQEAGHIDTDGSIPVPDKENMEAVGITYDSDSSSSPVISSIGKGERAEAIVEMAKSLGIYVHRDPQLLNELKRLEEGAKRTVRHNCHHSVFQLSAAGQDSRRLYPCRRYQGG